MHWPSFFDVCHTSDPPLPDYLTEPTPALSCTCRAGPPICFPTFPREKIAFLQRALQYARGKPEMSTEQAPAKSDRTDGAHNHRKYQCPPSRSCSIPWSTSAWVWGKIGAGGRKIGGGATNFLQRTFVPDPWHLGMGMGKIRGGTFEILCMDCACVFAQYIDVLKSVLKTVQLG